MEERRSGIQVQIRLNSARSDVKPRRRLKTRQKELCLLVTDEDQSSVMGEERPIRVLVAAAEHLTFKKRRF